MQLRSTAVGSGGEQLVTVVSEPGREHIENTRSVNSQRNLTQNETRKRDDASHGLKRPLHVL